jgi:TRAP-type C4-dicarboxylate transport system permease small subunit
MNRFQSGVFALSRACAYAAALVCVLMLGHILLEITLRTFFGRSTYVMDEFVGYGVGTMGFLALGYGLETGSLIRVTLLLDRLNAGARRIVELACCLLTLTAMAIPIWFFWLSVRRNYARGTGSATLADVPMWIPEGLLLVGMTMFWIQLFAYTLRAAAGRIGPLAARGPIDPT